MDDLYVIDWSSLSNDLIKKIKTGEVIIRNGVARDVLDNYKIVKHIPFQKISVGNGQDLISIAKQIQGGQALIAGSIGLSSVAIIGAVVISTMYICKKLDKIQKSINNLQKVVKQEFLSQNLVYYLEKTTAYFGAVESTRELIAMRYHSNNDVDNNDILIIKLSSLSDLRNQYLFFLDNIIHISDNFSPEHKEIVIDYINVTLNLVPKAFFIESQGYYQLEKIEFGDFIKKESQKKYEMIINKYKEWANREYRAIIAGEHNENSIVLQKKMPEIKSIVNSEENRIMLEYSI
ncbi:hypothetical protein [Desulfonatronovibrio magnus]|uniref:hypothetical protein n=1 Tax=Desulfonatronovibrio magnus TaxID=698827 RepID=UPI0005EB3C83|nr:hypothetical protein [Desulfonatronovibrio magnus]